MRTGKAPAFLPCALLALAAACAASAEPPVASTGALPAALAASGWTKLVPSLSPAEATALVQGIASLGDREFMDKAYGLILARDPESAYALGFSSRYGIPEDELSDLSDAYALGTRELYLALRVELGRRLPGAMGAPRTWYAAFDRWLSDRALDAEYSYDRHPVSPYVNSADELAIDYFTEYRKIGDEAEALRYIDCLGRLPAKMAGLVAALELRGRLGVVLPHGILGFKLDQVREISQAEAEYTPFYGALAGKLATSSVPEGATRDAILAKAASVIAAKVLPAWKTLAATLEGQMATAPDEGGATKLPNGQAYYAACLSRFTTTSLSAREIHEIGKRELARVQAEMRAAFAAMGFPKDLPLNQLFQRLGRSVGGLGGRGLMAEIDGYIKAMDARLGEIVAIRPRIGVEAVIGELGGYYQPPSADGSRPGRYFVAEGDQRWAFDVATTAFHETLPGHHLQIARALDAGNPGVLQSSDFLGYVEGWALYAERLASEMGFYKEDKASDLGRLRMEALRAARLVADTGVNAFGWTFGQTVAFLSENTGLEQGMCTSDASRYIMDPGQTTAYYMGMVEILRLRDKARSELGATFDLRRFHEAVLSGGSLPLDLLASSIDQFIISEKKR